MAHCETGRMNVFIPLAKMRSTVSPEAVANRRESPVERNRKMGRMSWGISSNTAIYPPYSRFSCKSSSSERERHSYLFFPSQMSALLIIIWEHWGGPVGLLIEGIKLKLAKWNSSACLGHSNLRSKARIPSIDYPTTTTSPSLDGFIDNRVCQIPSAFLVEMLESVYLCSKTDLPRPWEAIISKKNLCKRELSR